MDIGEEGRRVFLDLLDVEAIARVDAISDNARLEGAPQAADAVPATLGDLDRVGEGNSTTSHHVLARLLDKRQKRDCDRGQTCSYRGGPALPLGA